MTFIVKKMLKIYNLTRQLGSLFR